MQPLSINLFGTPNIIHNGEPVKITRRKALALLAYLAVTQNRHSRDHLAALFWPESDPSRARAALRSTLWALNNTPTADWLVVDSEKVALAPAPNGSDPEWIVDIVHFRELLELAQNHEHTTRKTCEICRDRLTRAVSLYTDDFLSGFTLPDTPQFDDWQFFQANALRQDLARTLEHLIEYHSAQGDFETAIPFARRFLAIDTYHEPAHQTLMRLYALAGQRSAALRQYEICCETLKSELGLEPSEETTVLYKKIHARSPIAGAGNPDSQYAGNGNDRKKSPKESAEIRHNLPAESTPLVGRQNELLELAELLDDPATRLVTIVGPGGIGKTRLALAAARSQVTQGRFTEGIFFVALTPLSEPDAIIPAIAEAIRYSFHADQRTPAQQIFDYLRGKTMLLVLDNFEHLLVEDQSAGYEMITDLLKNTQNIHILVTSREGLNLYEEQRFPLSGLTVSSGDANDAAINDAAHLFTQTARRKHPGFQVPPEDLPHLAEICRLVDGMPLALELAASWTDLLSLEEIAGKLHQNLDVLETNLVNLPARHHSMQAVFDTSWNSLREPEQKVYSQLTVFRDGFTFDAAEAVTDATLKTLATLVNKSLLVFNSLDKRYEIHELLRQLAAEKLTKTAAETRDRHAEYYCRYLQARERDLKGPRQGEVLAEIEAELRNAMDAWHWAVNQHQIDKLEMAYLPLCLYYQNRVRSNDGESMCRAGVNTLTEAVFEDGEMRIRSEASDDDDAQTLLLVQLLTWQSVFTLKTAEYDLTRRLLRKAQRILDTLDFESRDVRAARAFLLLQRSNYSISRDFGGETQALNEESLALYRSIDDLWGIAMALDGLSQKNMNQGLQEKAIEQQEECLEIRQKLGDPLGIARSYNLLGLFALHIGQIKRSEGYLRKSLSRFEKMGNRALLSSPMAVLGINLLFGGKFEECLETYDECWAIHDELGMPQEPFTANVAMVRAKINIGRYRDARAQAETNLEEYRRMNHPWSIAFMLFNLGRIELVEGAAELARERMEQSAEILQKMNERSLLPDVHFCLAYTHRTLNDREQALEEMVKGLKMAIETKPLNPMRFELPGMALLLVDQGDFEGAVEFYAAALKSPYIASSRWFEDVVGREIREIETGLPRDIRVQAQQRGQSRDLWETANLILPKLNAASLDSPGHKIRL